jgi:Flagellar protein YcgR/PilZ domain
MGSGTAIDEDRIVIGKPLPFSIFTRDGKLLLAQGQIVENDRMRHMLVRNGRRWERAEPDDEKGNLTALEEALTVSDNPLEELHTDYDTSRENHQLSISMARSEKEKAFPVQLIGVHKRCFIVTAPVRPDGSLVPVLNEQMWLCRTFQMTSAFRFTALVAKVGFEPYPHLYLRLMNEVEHRNIRGAPRAKVVLRAELHTPETVPCLISDLSTSGARIALDATLKSLENGQSATLVVALEVLQSKFELSLETAVINALGPIDSRHPKVVFYGLRFVAPSEKEHLVLHGFVAEHLISQLHGLWQMLNLATKSDAGRDSGTDRK